MWRLRWFMYQLYIHATSGFMMDSQFSLLVASNFYDMQVSKCSFTFRYLSDIFQIKNQEIAIFAMLP
jgi:hypothetical protein